MAAWNTGTVVGQRHWSAKLHTLYIDCAIEPYQAGQFVRIGLPDGGGQVLSRPYSLVNPPGRPPLEIYYIDVPGGQLTPRLAQLAAGDSILVAPRASGFMVLDEVPPARHLWLLSTGTGVGPFLAMLSTDALWQRFEKVVLVHAVRTLAELNYRERIQAALDAHPEQFAYIPFVSREACDFALPGRIPQALQSGALEARAGIRLTPQDSHVALCGNPAMLEEVTQRLLERGLKKHKRKDPGQITTESYW